MADCDQCGEPTRKNEGLCDRCEAWNWVMYLDLWGDFEHWRREYDHFREVYGEPPRKKGVDTVPRRQ